MINTGLSALKRRPALGTIPPPLLVLLAVLSVQVGAAIAKSLFSTLGPSGAVMLRAGFTALILLAIWRPRLRGYTRRQYLLVIAFGVAMGVMNFSFYSAISRGIPLGLAVTITFIGPLAMVVLNAKRARDLLWAALGAVGVVLLSPFDASRLDPLGLFFAILCAFCWSSYIALNRPVSRNFPGGEGLALGVSVAALLLLPVGLISMGINGALINLLNPALVLVGLGVSVLSSFIPYTLEYEALKRVPPRVFGVLLSIEPAVAALVGLIILGEALGLVEWLAIGLVCIAAAGASADQAA